MALIICEIGQNHCGDMELARRMILLAKDAGSDLVKFQLYDHKKLYGDKPVPNVELSFEQAKMLFDYGKEIGIEVFFSVFDVERVKWCEEIGVKRYKIACNQNKNKKLIHSVCSTKKQWFLSMSEWIQFSTILSGHWGSMQDAPRFFVPINEPDVLYCQSKYPAKTKDYKKEFDKLVGFPCIWGKDYWIGISDHTMDLDLARLSLVKTAGKCVIEKHFAIDHKTGVDAEWSMTPDELRELKRWEQVCQAVLQ